MQVSLEQAYEIALAEIGRLVVANKILSAGVQSAESESEAGAQGDG